MLIYLMTLFNNIMLQKLSKNLSLVLGQTLPLPNACTTNYIPKFSSLA